MKPDPNSVIALFAKNGLGNIFFEIEAAARYAAQFGKSLFIDLNESGHYGESEKRFEDYFKLRGVNLVQEIIPSEFKSPYPKDPALFNRSLIDRELRETKPHNSQWNRLAIWQKYDRWKYHWRYKKGGYALRNAEHLGLIGKNHDAVLFLTTYIRHEPERFFYLAFSDTLLQNANEYFSLHKLSLHPDLGIHVRFTDNMHHAGGRTKGGFKKALGFVDTYLNNNPEKVIPIVHLATDNMEVVELFKVQFADRIKLQTLPIERSTEAIHLNTAINKNQFDPYLSALYDIILLSNSSSLAYMGNSSFSRVARCMQPLHFEAFNWNV